MPRAALQESHGAGLPELREAIATHLRISRGIKCESEQVIITTGAEAAILIAATALGLRGARAWTEDPTYERQRGALRAAGVTAVPVPLDAQGLDVAHARDTAPDAKLALVTPSSQFPTTIAMSQARKRALLDWAIAHDGWIVEDDYDCEYVPAVSGKPMAAMPGHDRVIYVNTFSRTLFLSLRIGYLVAPPALVEPLLRARAAIDEHTTAPNQLVLCDFLTGGHFARHVRRSREAFTARREVLLGELEREVAPGLDIVNRSATSHLCIRLPASGDDVALAAQAAASGVVVHALSSNYAGTPADRGLLLGFAPHTPQSLGEGIAHLAPILRSSIVAR
jgi:GntR family transcriptional regulator/MocR family aminotransferase